MDIDNTTENPNGGSGGGVPDVEQALLQQFSCMGTTDRDELVKQLQRLLGSSLNWETAAFFLDMNNWNLQAAICSYFDIEAPSQLPSMKLVADFPAGDNGTVPINQQFSKTWEIQNNGTERWPNGCVLQNTAGEQIKSIQRIPIERLIPGEFTTVNVDMLTPSQPGMYQSKWRMCTEQGCYFGDTIVSIITVIDVDAVQLSQQLQTHLTELGRSPPSEPINPFGTQLRSPSQNVMMPDIIPESSNPAPPDSDMSMC